MKSINPDMNAMFSDSVMRCPVCGCQFVHAQSGCVLKGNDGEGECWDGTAGLPVQGTGESRRGSITLDFFGECGHRFTLGFQQHEGVTFLNVLKGRTMTDQQYEKALDRLHKPSALQRD